MEGGISIAYIIINNNEELERAIKRFRKQVDKEGITREWRRREYFEKPSTIRHKKKKAQLRKEQKRLRKLNNRKRY